MLSFEWLAGAWFAAMFVAAALTPVPKTRRALVMLGCVALVLVIGTTAARGSLTLRLWLPHLYLVAGYWLPALLVAPPPIPTRFERWLLGTDAALRPRLPAVPRWLEPFLQLSYLVCYPLVPVSFTIIWASGDPHDVSRFWVAVLLAGYACYGSLPWLVSRPPRLTAQSMVIPQPLGLANAFVLARVSHQLNTFPSGHVAVSSAAAWMLLTVSVPAGLVVGVIAAAIAVGAAAGRYHYVVDVVFGVIVAAVALVIANAAG
jgi:membrane-associated phospholipid phosphatase